MAEPVDVVASPEKEIMVRSFSLAAQTQAQARLAIRALCMAPKQDLHLYAVLRTSSLYMVKPSKSSSRYVLVCPPYFFCLASRKSFLGDGACT